MLEAKKDELFVAPAIGLLYTRTYEGEKFGVTRDGPKNMGAAAGLERTQKLYPKMRKRGIRVLPGGDYGFPYNPIGTNARDLQWFVELLGYTPTEALVTATRLGGSRDDISPIVRRQTSAGERETGQSVRRIATRGG